MPGTRELRTHMTYARVVGALAILLIALGGGYSLAFSGSGKLQKENELGFVQGEDEVIRTIGGVGPLRGFCEPGGNTRVLLQNDDAGKDLLAYTDKFDESDSVLPVATTTIEGGGDNETIGVIEPGNDAGVLRIHVFPVDGSKAPQAKITVGVVATGDCATSQVSVLNLTTEG